MDFDERFNKLESNVSYILSEISAARLQEIEDQIAFLLGQIEGKHKLSQLIDVFQHENEELCKQRNKLIHEKATLQAAFSAQKILINKLELRLNDSGNSLLLAKLADITNLLFQAQGQSEDLIKDFTIG